MKTTLTVEFGPITLEVLERIATVLTGSHQPRPLKAGEDRMHHGPLESVALAPLAAGLVELRELMLSMQRPVTEKEYYSVEELATRSQKEGTKRYSKFTIRQACNTGRIPEAKKAHSGREWLIPHSAYRRILNEGLPAKPKS